MTIKDRIETFIKHQGIRRSTFEKSCGFSNGYTRNLKENPSASKIEDILNAYPELNRIWLLTGEGEMLKDSLTNVGEVYGNDNTIGMTVTQTIAENNGQNAGRDITNYGDRALLDEIIAQRKITETAQMQLTTAQAQITELINQNKEQFAQFMALFQSLKQATI